MAHTRRDRVLYRRATAADEGGKGRRPVFGAAFRCRDATTWSVPDKTVQLTDAQHGQVELQLWRGLGLRHKGPFVAVDLYVKHTKMWGNNYPGCGNGGLTPVFQVYPNFSKKLTTWRLPAC